MKLKKGFEYMRWIKEKDANYYSGDGYSGYDYPMDDSDINLAVIQINGRSPKSGYQVNCDCKELLYISNGEGTLYKKDTNDVISFQKGDLIVIEQNECYTFDVNFEAVVPCTPAWREEQHKYLD